jgi:hypothetical protein
MDADFSIMIKFMEELAGGPVVAAHEKDVTS